MTPEDFSNYSLHKDANLFIFSDPDKLDGEKEAMFFDYWHPLINGWSWSISFDDYDLEDGVYPFSLELGGEIFEGYAFVYHGLINAQHLLSQLPSRKYDGIKFLEYMEEIDGVLEIYCNW